MRSHNDTPLDLRHIPSLRRSYTRLQAFTAGSCFCTSAGRLEFPKACANRVPTTHKHGDRDTQLKWRSDCRVQGIMGEQVPWCMQDSKLNETSTNASSQATVEDLDPPPALSVKPTDPISWALMSGLERDYTHLTVVSQENRALLGYISIPRLQELLKERKVSENDPVEAAMHKFQRRGRRYKVIDMETPLEELEEFFKGGVDGSGKQDFAVVTDASRKFVLGVATTSDLDKFIKTRA